MKVKTLKGRIEHLEKSALYNVLLDAGLFTEVVDLPVVARKEPQPAVWKIAYGYSSSLPSIHVECVCGRNDVLGSLGGDSYRFKHCWGEERIPQQIVDQFLQG
jgi:hypothetical protein